MSDFFEVDVDAIGAEELAASEQLLKFDLGDTRLRILPPWRQGAQYYKPYRMHFALSDLRNFGLEVEGWYAEPCLSEVAVFDGSSWVIEKNKCPICSLANEAWRIGSKTGDAEVTDMARKIRAKRQYASNVIDLDNMDKGVQIMVYGKKVFDGTKALFIRRGNITHIQKGYSIFVTKSEIQNQKWCDYTVTQDEQADFSEEWEVIKGQLNDLDKFPEYSTYDEIKSRVETVSFGGGISMPTPASQPTAPDGYTEPKEASDDIDDLLSGIGS